MIYQITHKTLYHYSETVGLCHNEARLKPRDCNWQRLLSHDLQITPGPSTCGERTDFFGNHASWFSFNEGYEALTVNAISRVELQSRSKPDSTPTSRELRDLLADGTDPDSIDASQFAHPSPRVSWDSELYSYAASSFPDSRPVHEGLTDLLARIDKEFEFDNTATTVNTPVKEVFRKRRGVCQDFAHLALAMLRSLKLSARYVSGYIRTHPPPGKPRRAGTDASHAWLSVFAGPAGWIDIDPTNNSFADLEHITIAWGRDYSDVCPLKGVLIGGGPHSLDVSVDVSPLNNGD